MVPRSGTICQTSAWKQELAEAYRRLDDLLAACGLVAAEVPDLDLLPADFRLLVPRGFAALMRRGDPRDPLLRQVLPLRAERHLTPGYVLDPVGDGAAARGQGLLHKYAGRALILMTDACAVHCRYCFRKHFDYEGLVPSAQRQAAVVAAIRADESLREIILSGGDPLLLSDGMLGRWLHRLDAIAHLRRLRIHTRLPVVLPSRITESLVRVLRATRLDVTVVIHANHPNELGVAAEHALRRLRRGGITLLNQSVLLRGVNDQVATLEALSERLFSCSTLPYYLHQLDPVQGAAHFAVTDRDALILEERLRTRLSGYLMPRLVREHPGAFAKMPVSSDGWFSRLLNPGVSLNDPEDP
ncbi:EF-P beta-lysylation protein EpmB [Thiocapsa imhoffii]|uniref:L-lysine 2,3-aminomutase n=1 Tax=Thiocapsa imhoffii TaxID=382777 RepID=A0A9X1BA65_9GAMM|nr:EF-P beta-lysylation protein EpmB [Thiocapsa imhoffii]MBK1645756.1 EF-P beta-lysylation protein EpmB [Thiocapsa imhoffii]